MTENEEKSKTRFSRATLIRILAVGLFVTIGTVAVVYLMSHSRKKNDETASEKVSEGAQLAVGEQSMEGLANSGIPAKAELKAKTSTDSDNNDINRSTNPASSPTARSSPQPTFSDSSFNPATDRFAAVPSLERPNPPADPARGSFAADDSPFPGGFPAEAKSSAENREITNQKPTSFLPELPNQFQSSGDSSGSAANPNRSFDNQSLDIPSDNGPVSTSRSVDPASKPAEGNPLAAMAKQSLNEIQAAFGAGNSSPTTSAPSDSKPLPPPALPNRINTSPTESEPRLQGPTPQKPLNSPSVDSDAANRGASTPSAFAPPSAPPTRSASAQPGFSGFDPATGPAEPSANFPQARSNNPANESLSGVSNQADPRSNPAGTPFNSGALPASGFNSAVPPAASRSGASDPTPGYPSSNSIPANSFGTTHSPDDARIAAASRTQEPFENATAAPRSSVLESPENANPASPSNFQANLTSPASIPPLSAPPGNGSVDPGRMGSNQPLARTANVPGERKLEGVQAPSLTIEKLSPREITVNEAAKFMIVIRNVGRVDAMDVQVHDQVPVNTEFAGSNPPVASQADRKIVWELGSIPVGKEARIEYQLKPLAPGEIGSVAQVTFATQASMRTMVTQPELEMVLRTKPVVMIGGDVVIEAMITNRGNGPAKQVMVQKDVPPQLEFQEGYRELEYEVGTLLPGQSKRIQLALKAAKTGRVKNVMVATAVGGQRVQQEFDLEIVAPEIKLAADGPTRRFLNRQLTNTFSLSNQGTAAATNVELVARLPRGLKFVSANNQGIYRPQNHAVVWSMAQLPTNVDAQVELVTLPVEIGEQDIQFQIAADLNIRNSISHLIQVENSVDIYFDIRDMVDPIEVGAETAYLVRLVNQGTIVATNVRLQAQFPAGLVPVSVEGNLSNQIVGQNVQFSPVASLRPGEEFQLRIRAKGSGPGDHRVILTMQADGRETPVTKEEATRVYTDR